MEIEKGLNPNCSEAVFRFYTLEPKKIQQILQIIVDKIDSCYPKEPRQKIPLFETAEKYDTGWNKEKTYNGKVRNKYEKQRSKIWEDRDKGKISQKEVFKRIDEMREKISKEVYPNTLIRCCAGLGDNEAVITIEKKKSAFRLNIGNNDISANDMSWVDAIKSIGIKVEEAETCKNLEKYARDCTCGIIFGF